MSEKSVVLRVGCKLLGDLRGILTADSGQSFMGCLMVKLKGLPDHSCF